MVEEGQIKGYEVPSLRATLLEGRMKITELYQKFKKELETSEPIPGKIDVTRFRAGRMPFLKLDFSFANNTISGNLVSVIAPKPVPQTNVDILRF